MVNEKASAYGSTGVYLDPGNAARQMGKEARRPFEPGFPQRMGNPVHYACMQAGIAGHDLKGGARGGVTVEHTVDVLTRGNVNQQGNQQPGAQDEESQAADQKVSESDWWSDTLERDWIVKRPFGPGIFDSTHWFYVSYKVNGRILMSWFVDLSKGTVSDIAPPEKQSAH